ncbi:histidine kinase [Dyadobacter chenwenxiniae]|uniref:Histidine kinase n=1 Tax=Dyadobacter chenwenxiniae TaxID=2906456 RepID=A0A9X1PTC3_9BACT|nr:two-component regulator propeller domain-containing protein [Dyadobacter chenwenxiniae]MCF0064761.1 histidine kinase [Dyadobacter chenwenxiniae]UON84185.1 histidine kinase [Dyadobacter chenwenxiniae]
MTWRQSLRKVFSVFILILLSMVAYAHKLAQQHYTIADGLDNVRVYFLLPDQASRIWVATDWGLDFFDEEHQLVASARLPKLPKGLINDLAVGPDGTIWVAGNKLYKLKISADLKLQVDTTIVGYAPHYNRVGTSYLTVDHQNRAWFAGLPDAHFTENGISYLEGNQVHDMTGKLFPGEKPQIVDMRADWGGKRLLIVTKDGRLWQWKNEKMSVIKVEGKVRRILQSPSGQLFALTNSAAFQLKPNDTELAVSIPADISKMEVFAISDKLEIAFAAETGNICWYDGDDVFNSGVKTATVRSMIFDKNGDLWVGTINGINRIIRAGWRYFDHSVGLPEETVSVTEDRNGVMWFASRGRGLSKLINGKIVEDSTYYSTFPVKDFIAATNRDADGNLIFSSVGGKGLLWYDGKNYRRLPGSETGNNIRGFYDDVAGNRYLFACSKMLLIYNRRTLQLVRRIALPSTGYYDIEKDRFGRLWIAGQNSCVIWDGKSDHFETMHYNAQHFSSWMVFDLHRDAHGNMWLATDEGLWLYDYKRFRRVAGSHLRRVINFCQPLGDSYLLLGAIEGLYVLDLEKYYENGEEWISWFDHKNGYEGQSVSHACFRDSCKRWWMTTHDRLMMIPEADLLKLLKRVPTGIRALRDVSTATVFPAGIGPLRLSPYLKDLEIQLLEPNHQNLLANSVYVYKIERLDNPDPELEWSDPIQRSSIPLKNLSDGKYRITLKVLRANGMWNTKDVVQEFEIAPFWYATTWFRTLLALVIAGCIFYFILREVKKQARRQQEILRAKQRVTELELEASERRNVEAGMSRELAEAGRERALLEMRAITNQIDPHFVSNFLTAVQSMLYKNESEKVVHYLAKFGSIFRHKLLSRSQVFWTLGEEMDFVSNYLELEKVRFRHRIQSVTEVEAGVPMDTVIPKMLIQGYVSNAIKHGLENKPEGGTVCISVSVWEQHLYIKVEDDGVGLEKARQYNKRSTGRGLAINEALFDQLNQYNVYKSYQVYSDRSKMGEDGVCAEAFLPLYPILPPEELVAVTNDSY